MKNILSVFLLLLISFYFGSTHSYSGDLEQESRYEIRYGSAVFTPPVSYRASISDRAQHFILQFHKIPDADRRARLEKTGIRFYRYIGGNAYIVRKEKPAAEISPTLAQLGIRAVLNLSPDMRISSVFKKNPELWRRTQADETLGFHVKFFPGVSQEKAVSILESRTLSLKKDSFDPGQSVEIECSWQEIAGLLLLEEVEWVDPAAPARGLENRVAALRSNVNYVRNEPKFRNADGGSAIVGVWDGGPVDDHPDLAGRVTIIEEEHDPHFHATHVAGTIAGSGLGNPSALGMAPAARIYSYDFYGNVVKEMRSALKAYGVTITSNSWGSVDGWQYYQDPENDADSYNYWAGDWMFGYYHDEQRVLDDFIRKHDILAVFAAGNDRGDSYLGPHKHESGEQRILPSGFAAGYSNSDNEDEFYEDIHPSDPEYASVATWACAKNNLTVGATMKDDVITGFSSWGPTLDGRIKPDVVTNGYRLNSTYLDGEYRRFSGTSMATPTASGTAALLADYYFRRHDKKIGGLSLKNLLVHSARDLGRPGPDYTFGHGIVDGEMGARVIRTAVFNDSDLESSLAPASKKRDIDPNMQSLMIEDSLDNEMRHKYYFTVPEDTKELRVTLVWHDPGGSKLINNLDLIVTPYQSAAVRPFFLDPGNPSALAQAGRNKVDNVESIKILSPKAGPAKIVVVGKKVPEGPQKYSLIASAGDGNRVPETMNVGRFSLYRVITCIETENYTESNLFTTGNTFFPLSTGFVEENSDYGGYYGSISQTWTITNQGGDEVLKLFRANDQYGAGNPGEYFYGWMGTYQIPSGLPRGWYIIRNTITMHNGYSVSRSYNFTVQ